MNHQKYKKYFRKENIVICLTIFTMISLVFKKRDKESVSLEIDTKIEEVSHVDTSTDYELIYKNTKSLEIETLRQEIEALKRDLKSNEIVKKEKKENRLLSKIKQNLNIKNSAPKRKTISLSKNNVLRPKTTRFDVPMKMPNLNKTIPKGTYVEATLLNGVEPRNGQVEPVLMALDGVMYMPNGYVADLKGCVALGKAEGSEANERVCIQIHDIACVDGSGEALERKLNGFVTDAKDNVNCGIGKINQKSNKALINTTLASIIQSAGDAIRNAGMTTAITPLGGAINTVNNVGKASLGGGLSGAGSFIAQWYMKRAEALFPTINIHSGRKVWIATLSSIKLPKAYFYKEKKNEEVNTLF